MRPRTSTAADVAGPLECGRDACERRAWSDAHRNLSLADSTTPLAAADLELLAMSAYLISRDEHYLTTLDRAFHAWLDANEGLRAARCAFWSGLRFLFKGEEGRASGWFARARRLVECEGQQCAEAGYLLLPVAEEHLKAADGAGAFAIAGDAADIGHRFREADLVAIARHLQGRALIQQGRVEDGLSLLDETMLAVSSGELGPLVTGLIYCSVIDSCRQVLALERAGEWTTALARWCEGQPEMVSFTGRCLVHRAEVLQLQGAWREALDEARRCCDRFEKGVDPQRPAAAFYQLAEIYRLQGNFAAAEEAYRQASTWGMEPQPGLALLRMMQGRLPLALNAIRRAASATTDSLELARLLPPYVEIALRAGAAEDARTACSQLEEIARRFGTRPLRAISDQARAAVDLAAGNPKAALVSLRRALEAWQQIPAPYLAARARLLTGMACRALADTEGADLDLQAARVAFERLGAVPDVARLDALTKESSLSVARDLTSRERQVLRQVASGKSNKVIAAELSLSERTVDRHVSNIFGKLSLRSRAAATAYAYQHGLI